MYIMYMTQCFNFLLTMSNFTLGLNWYLTNNTRIMFNSIHVDLEETKGDARDDPVTEDFWVHGMRWQYKW